MTAGDPLAFGAFADFLASAENRFQKRRRELGDFFAPRRVCLFGYGGKGRALARQIAEGSDTQVLVYDASPKARILAANDGFAVAASLQECCDTGDPVILAACQAQLEQADLVAMNHIFYQEAAYLFDVSHLANKAREFTSWISSNKVALYDLYTALHPRSRDVLVKVLSFRLSLDPHDLTGARTNCAEMWFDVPKACSQRNYTTFLDVGAFDGDTLLQAQKRLSVTRGIAVEANPVLFQSIRTIARFYRNEIKIVPYAAWSHTCRLRFSEVRGGMISVAEADDGELEARAIDESVDEQIDLIKMDIEGAELPALAGCLRTLKTGPDMAIAAYHRPDDLLRIPAFVKTAGYSGNYFDLHLGHYSDCFDDTILYYLKR